MRTCGYLPERPRAHTEPVSMVQNADLNPAQVEHQNIVAVPPGISQLTIRRASHF